MCELLAKFEESSGLKLSCVHVILFVLKLFKINQLVVEAGESEYSGLLKTRNLLIFRDAQNAENDKIAPNWNVSGTRDFQPACHISFSGNYVILLGD
jgi:hypothetical protein